MNIKIGKMSIDPNKIPIRDLVKDYADKGEDGVTGYGDNLDIRPIYQREFVYKDKQRNAVIETIFKGFPLNVLYWAVNKGGKYEVLDGQQRIISICQYVIGDFSINHQYFHNLTEEEQNAILDYELMVYFCKGDHRAKLDWFKTINIASEKLTDQELRNAVYSGPWVSDAKADFSRNGCRAYGLASKYVKGSPIRQEFLETAIDWISNGEIEEYMAMHQDDKNASPLWQHFEAVIGWVERIFPKDNYRKEMKGLPWGEFFAEHGQRMDLNAVDLEIQIAELMADEDVTKKSGIYFYVLAKDKKKAEKHLSIRAFSEGQKRTVLTQQGGKCKMCDKEISLDEAEGDHIDPWSEGGKTELDNCQVLCKPCNRRKSDA